jgi:hypothetical protein
MWLVEFKKIKVKQINSQLEYCDQIQEDIFLHEYCSVYIEDFDYIVG